MSYFGLFVVFNVEAVIDVVGHFHGTESQAFFIKDAFSACHMFVVCLKILAIESGQLDNKVFPAHSV